MTAQLAYEASEQCPSRADFLALVSARTSKADWTEGDTEGRKFLVTAVADSLGAHGRLVVLGQGPRAIREISARTCQEVVAALALFTSLVIDPDANIDAVAPAESAKEPAHAAPADMARSDQNARTEPTVAPSQEDRPWRVIVGAQGKGRLRTMPGLGYGGSVFTEATRGGGFLSFTWRLGASYTQNDAQPASVRMFTGLLAECPLLLRVSTSLEVLACLGLDIGVLNARATATTGNVRPLSPANRPWFAGDVHARGRWFLTAVFVEAGVGANVPFTTYDLLVMHASTGAADRTVYSIPLLGFSADLGIGLRLP